MFLYQKFPMFTKYRFVNTSCELGHAFKFSSELEKIGLEWDVSLQNGAYVDVISDPIEITRPQYGTFSVVKIKADVATDYHTIIKECWVPAMCIYKVGEDETSSSQLTN